MILIVYYSKLLNHVSLKSKNRSYRYISVVSGLLNFLTRDLVTLNKYSIDITQAAFAVGPIRNAENIESLQSGRTISPPTPLHYVPQGMQIVFRARLIF